MDAHHPFGDGGDEEDSDDIHAVDDDSFDHKGDDDTADVAAAVDGDTYDDVDIVADSTAPLRP